ncbi:hypothetical protein ABT121_09230 [Streptomyces sp. NPDC001928]|uniref:hypothetical protein n=1 Tax=Streptomyces sp. NPDC001928 TaxID=3154404 RepID=UPI00332D2EB4
MQWQVFMVSVMLLIGAVVGAAELKRRRKPEQQRIKEAEQRFFIGSEPSIEVGAYEANLKSEPLTRLALMHGYELERTERSGAAGYTRSLKYHFVLRGTEAEPAPFMPESPHYESYMRWETARKQKVRRFYIVLCAVFLAVVGLLWMVRP